MRFLPYILKHLRRDWVRTASTVMGMAVCVFLFCTLRTVLQAMDDAREYGSVSRLITRHAVSLAYNLPLSYQGRIAQVGGVKRVAISTWFGGSLPVKKERQDVRRSGAPDFSKFFTNLAVEHEPYFAMHRELVVPAPEMAAFREDLRGCLIGRGLAQQFGWKVGDTFFLESFIPAFRRRQGPFEFVVRGIYDADLALEPAADNRFMYFHYKYLYEGMGRRIGTGVFVVELEDGRQSAAVARAIDGVFENSEAETKTQTEAAFRADFAARVGNLSLLLNSIGLAVIFTVLLVTGNTMSIAVRERRTEIAVLKTLGFSSGRVMGLVLAEAVAIGAFGGALGLGLSALMIETLPRLPSIGAFIRGLPTFGLHWAVSSQGLGIAVLVALVAGLLPALAAYRARIVDMLRQA